MFIVGKKYVFSRRKFIKVFGKKDSREEWVRRLIGIVFVATESSSNTNIIPHGWEMDDDGFGVSRAWCTEIK